MVYLKIKRLIDIILSTLGLIILSPVFLVLIIAIKLDSPGPVLFKQKRVGIHKSHFHILKFRTMRIDTPKEMPTHLLENPDQWITKVGKFLRKTSLDELPQIINIFKGEMSIIGPRPALWNQYDLIEERDKYGANDVPVGLTGWAQINGRDELEIDVKARLDGEYAEKIGLLMDVRCFFGTIFSVLRGDGVVEGGTGTLGQKEISVSIDDFHSIEKSFKQLGAVRVTSGINIQDVNNMDTRNNNIEQHLVSVIVATYRRDVGLKNALISIVNQTYESVEVIVVDDNADEKWNEKVENIVALINRKYNRRIVYIKNDVNKGSAETRNIGIKKASGDYITFLDDDDIYMPNKIKNQLDHMLKESSDFSLTDLFLYDESDNLIEKRNRRYIKRNNKEDLLMYHFMYHMTGTDTMMFKKDYLLQIGGFPLINIGDEFYLMHKAIECGGRFSYLPECDIKAYVHIKTIGLSSGDGKIEGENNLYKYKKKYFNSLPKASKRYINMRHYAVLAFAELRRKKYASCFKYTVKSFISSPLNCALLFIRRK